MFREGEEVELKRAWTEKALEDLAAFANTRGGTLYLGIEDDGHVVGFATTDEEVRRLIQGIADRLGINPSLRQLEIEGKPVLEVRVEPSRPPVALRGRFYRRVGSTNREVLPEELSRFFLERSGQTWDALPGPWGLEALSPPLWKRFVHLAQPKLPHLDPREPLLGLRNLGLLREDRLTHGAILLFTERPQDLFPNARMRFGVFRSGVILDSRDFKGSLLEQLEGILEQLRLTLEVSLHIRAQEASLEGLRHQEIWEYPLEALREALLNALIHRDYAALGDVEVRLYEDRLLIWNPGGLPEGVSLEDLRKPVHPSVRRNPLLAEAFFQMGLIERWGTGTTRILELCRTQGLPEPEFVAQPEAFQVNFFKDLYTPERLRAWGLNERQVQAVLHAKSHGSINNEGYRKLTGASKPTATRDLEDLVTKGIFERKGRRGPGIKYTLTGSKKAQWDQEGLKEGSS